MATSRSALVLVVTAAAVMLASACGGSPDRTGAGSTTSTAPSVGGSSTSTAAPTTTAPTGTGTAASAMAAIAAGVKDRMENPGMQVFVAQGAEELSREFGNAVLSPVRPMVRTDRLMVASVTKPVVATVVMRLVEQGRLKTTDLAEKYLGTTIRPGSGITVEDLLDMRSGLPDYADQPGFTPGTLTSAQLLGLVKAVPVRAQPGTVTDYVNTNYAALDLVVQKVTGHSLADAVDELVARPAGLTRTTLGGEPTARGYAGAYAGAPDITPRVTHPSAGAGLVSSATDLGHFLQALVGGRLVSPATLAVMSRPRGEMEDGGYGMGLISYQTRCGTAIGHFGKNDAYVAAAFALPSTGRVVAVTANSSANDTLQLVVVAEGLCA
jgi:CubicO group peptidase (beta-lactamase class C family)